MSPETEALEISHNSNPNSAYTIESLLKSVTIEIPSTSDLHLGTQKETFGKSILNFKKKMKVRMVRAGTGPPIEGCRSFVSMISCSSKGKCKTPDKVHSHNCHRFYCKTCCGGEAKAKSRDIEDRLEGMTNRFYDTGIPAGRPKQVVVSKSPKQIEDEYNGLSNDNRDPVQIKRFIQDCIEVVRSNAKELHPDQDGKDVYSKEGFAGGVFTFHPERKKGLNRDTYEWETVQDDKWDNQKYIRYKWVWGPHVHFVCYGFFKSSKEIFKGHFKEDGTQTKKQKRQSGFLFKIVPTEDGADRSIKDTMEYLLTHAGLYIDDNGDQVGKAYSYFGAYASIKGGAWWSGHWLEEKQICEDESCQLRLDEWTFSPVQVSEDVPIEDGRPILEIKNNRPVIEAPDPLDSWERDPHDIMHGWESDQYVIWKKVYLYFLHGEPRPVRVLDGPRPPSRWRGRT